MAHFPILYDRLRIGRSKDADLYIENTALSRLHAEVIVDAGTFSLMDLGSLNGTFLNGFQIPAREPAMLRNEDVIRIGDWTAKFHAGQQ